MEEFIHTFHSLQLYLTDVEKENKTVSRATVGWHVEHCLLIINSSLKGLKYTNPDEYKPVNSFKKVMTLWFQYIPKGKLQAPKPFVPIGIPSKESIEKLIENAKEHLSNVADLSENSFIKHPHLGPLNKAATFKFLKVHTHHHIKIIQEILREPF